MVQDILNYIYLIRKVERDDLMEKRFNQITKLLEKIFKAGYITEKDILNIQLEDLVKINDISNTEIAILLDFKKAIRNKKIIAFLSDTEEKKEGKENETRI